jgi:hypothetical protein
MSREKLKKVNRLSETDSWEIHLQTLAAQLGVELIISSGKVYCSSEFHYKTFNSTREAEKYLLTLQSKHQFPNLIKLIKS